MSNWNIMKNLELNYQGKNAGSPKTLPSLSSSLSPNLRSLSPMSVQQKTTFSRQIEKLPYIAKLESSKLKTRQFLNFKPELQPNKIVFCRLGKVKIVAANTCAGTLNKKNEDRIRILLNLKQPLLFFENKWPKSSYFGIFDGHGGSACAEFLKDNLHDYIFTNKCFPYRLKQAIYQGFCHSESRFFEIAEENTDFSGSCALITIIIGNKCVVGNIGDTQAILSVNNGEKIVVVSTEHKPLNETEREIVLKNGGKLFCEYYIDEKGDKVETGDYFVNPGGLKVTRCIGSIHAKLKKYGGQPELYKPEPSIKSFKIKDNYDFLLMASSGLFNQLSCQDLINLVWVGINSCNSSPEEKLDEGLKYLLNHAISVQCEQNFSVIIIGFQHLINHCK